MTKYDARNKAHDLWFRHYGLHAIGNRRAFTCIRRKTVELRFEVGYIEHLGSDMWRTVILGRGRTWEEAFTAAEQIEVR